MLRDLNNFYEKKNYLVVFVSHFYIRVFGHLW